MLVAPATAQVEDKNGAQKEAAQSAKPSEGSESTARPDGPLTIVFFRQPDRRADGAMAFGEGLADAVSAVNKRDGGLNNVPVAFAECETPVAADAAPLLGDAACDGKAKDALLAIVWPREDVEGFVLAAERTGLPLLAPAGRDVMADGARLRWSFSPPVSLADQAASLLQLSRIAEGGDKAVDRIGLFHATDAWGVDMRDALMSVADLGGITLQTYSVRPGEAQDVVSTFRDFGANPPDRLVVWGNGSLSETVLREAVRRNYPTDRILGGFADGADAAVQDLGTRAKGFRVAALAAFGEAKGAPGAANASGADDDDAAPVSPIRMAGQLIGALSIEALGAAQELGETRAPSRSDVRSALERIRLTPRRLRSLDLAEPAAAFGMSCADHAGSLAPSLLEWNGERFVRKTVPEVKSAPLALAGMRGDRAKALAGRIEDGERAQAPACPASERSG